MPVFLKFVRLVSAVLFIQISADFIYVSLSTTKHGVAPDFVDVEAARTRSVYMSSGLQLFDKCVSCGSRISCSTVDALAAFLSAYTGRISTRYGSSVLLKVCPRFHLLHCHAHAPVVSHQPRCPRRACLSLSGPSARITSSRLSLTQYNSPPRPSCRPVTPRHS